MSRSPLIRSPRIRSPLPRSRMSRVVLALTLSAAALASPAFAKTKPVVVPASVFAKEDSKLCMPRTVLAAVTDKNALKALPQTICDTKAGWEERGLAFTLK